MLHRRVGFAAVVASLLWAFSLVSAQSAWPIGEVQIQGTATITKASGGTVTVSNGSYTWFPGDQIVNGSGQSLLVLDNGVTLGLGEGAIATVSVTEAGLTTVEMTQGSVLYTTTPESDVQFTAGEVVMTTSSAPSSGGAVGLIQMDMDGSSKVEVVDGKLLATMDTAEGAQLVEMTAGDSYLVSADGIVPNTISPDAIASEGLATGTNPVATSAGEASGASVGTTSNSTSTLLGGFSLAVTAASTYVIAFDDDEAPVTEPPVSP